MTGVPAFLHPEHGATFKGEILAEVERLAASLPGTVSQIPYAKLLAQTSNPVIAISYAPKPARK